MSAKYCRLAKTHSLAFRPLVGWLVGWRFGGAAGCSDERLRTLLLHIHKSWLVVLNYLLKWHDIIYVSN